MAELNRVLHLNPGVLLEDVEGDVLAFDGETLTRVTGAAAVLVRAVDGIRSLADLGQALGPDARDAVDTLLDHGLVDVREPSPGQLYRRPDHIGTCLDGDRVVLIDLSTGDRHVLEGGGSTIWELVTSGHSLSSAIDELERAYPGSGVADEAIRLVDQLVAIGLLQAPGAISSSDRPDSS